MFIPLFGLISLSACDDDDSPYAADALDQGAYTPPEEEDASVTPPEEVDAPPPQRLDAPADGLRGPHPVGYRVYTFEEGGAAPLVIKAWYPALDPGGAEGAIEYAITLKTPGWREAVEAPMIRGRALEDAAINDAQAAPVILFSHGFGMNPEWYSALTEHYASHGFIVLAPEHIEEDWFEVSGASFDRPIDVTRTLDFAESLAEGGAWAGLIDLEKIALVGHSYGGYTALAAAGARFDLAEFSAHCAALPQDDPSGFLCAPFMGREEDMAARAGLEAPPEGLWPALGDDRIKAIVPIAGDAYLFGEAGLAEITVPVMAIGGTADFGTPWGMGARPTYERSSSALKALVGLQGGDHFLPCNLCDDMPWVSQIEEVYAYACFDPVWDKARGLDLIQHFSTAFLRHALEGEAEAAAALSPAAVWMPGIEYATTLE